MHIIFSTYDIVDLALCAVMPCYVLWFSLCPGDIKGLAVGKIQRQIFHSPNLKPREQRVFHIEAAAAEAAVPRSLNCNKSV